MILSDRAQFLVDNLDLPEAAQVENARWEHFQLAHLSDSSTFRIENKSRQIAWSFTIAAEAIANAVLSGISSIFQSINQEEAQEKIIYARRVLDNLRIGGLPSVTQPDNQTTLGFSNGARIISVSGKPHRGKARFWVYFDEWAHQQYDRENYRAALPIISKGGVVRGASSPLGASGLFWEIYTESMQKFPGFTRKRTPWWEIYSFCTDVKEARRVAPTLTTAERVERFGNERIKLIFENSILEDFQAEYETAFVDESSSWITWEEIKNAQDANLLCHFSTDTGAIEQAKQAIDTLSLDWSQSKVEAVLGAGYDVGRTRNTSELYIVGQTTTGTYPLRAAITLDNCEFDDQLEVLTYAIIRLPIGVMLIDRNGLGMNLAENMEGRFPGKALGLDFTNPSKALLASDARMLIQQRRTPLPINRDMAYQIHSIKKNVTAAKNTTFDTDATAHHCYDENTEMLTADGWKLISNVTINDRVATLSDDQLLFEYPSEVQAFDYEEKMIRVKNKQVDLLVTPNHRMYVHGYYRKDWQFLPASDLLKMPNHRWRFRKWADWQGDDTPEVPIGTPEQFARFLGYYITEGCKASQYRVILYQNAGEVADKMIGTLREMGKENITISQTINGALRIECYWKELHKAMPDGVASEKRLPRYVFDWSPRLLYILLVAMMDGDGSIGTTGQWTYYTTSRGLADDLTELLLRVGWCGSVVSHQASAESWTISPMWRVNINRTRLTPIINKRESNISIQKYSGKVYCVTNRTHLLYVRRNGVSVWCGNSDKFWAWALALCAASRVGPPEPVEVDYQPVMIGGGW